MAKTCGNCKFTEYDADDYPCDECVCCSKWKPMRRYREELLVKLNHHCFYENIKYSGCEDCPGCVLNSVCKHNYNFEDMSDAMLEKAVALIEHPEPNADLDESTNDHVNHPNHYCQGGVECIDAMEAAFSKQTVADFCICNAFKYIFRCKNKNGLEDVKKARWYLDKYLKLYEEMM